MRAVFSSNLKPKGWTLFFALTLISATAQSQQYVAEAAVPPVQTSGFYRIMLEPGVTSAASGSLSNIRIVTNTGEVPYLMRTEAPTFVQTNFKEYKIISKQLEPNCCTRLTLHNPRRAALYNVSLQIKNADTRKQASLYGSDDQTTWYALKENFYFDALNNPSETYEMNVLHFPLANYEFLSLVLNDSITAPLNILKAGYYETQSGVGQYVEVSPAKLVVSQNKKRKETHVVLSFDSAQLVNKIEFTISEPPLYHRHARLYEQAMQKNRKGKLQNVNNFLQYLDLTSTHAPTVLLEEGKFKNLLLIIENDDNPPLKITGASAYQLNRYLVAWLDKGITYTLKLGPEHLTPPVYDLGYFSEKMPVSPPVLRPGKLTHVAPKHQAPQSIFSKPLIYSSLLAVGVILIYMTVRMIQEGKNNPTG